MTKTATWRNTPFAHKFYHSKEWKRVRSLVWDRAHGLCERCLENNEVKPANVVHHKIPLSVSNMDDPTITLNADNLIALCDECHTEVHGELGMGAMNGHTPQKPRVAFDASGNIVKLESEE